MRRPNGQLLPALLQDDQVRQHLGAVDMPTLPLRATLGHLRMHILQASPLPLLHIECVTAVLLPRGVRDTIGPASTLLVTRQNPVRPRRDILGCLGRHLGRKTTNSASHSGRDSSPHPPQWTASAQTDMAHIITTWHRAGSLVMTVLISLLPAFLFAHLGLASLLHAPRGIPISGAFPGSVQH